MMQRSPYLLEMNPARIDTDEQEKREKVSENAVESPMEDT